jgi:hypothetical protein
MPGPITGRFVSFRTKSLASASKAAVSSSAKSSVRDRMKPLVSDAPDTDEITDTRRLSPESTR